MENRWVRWLIALLYFGLVVIFIVLGIFGLGLFGIPVTLTLMTLIYFSPSYRAWFYRQPGYRHRLVKLPFLEHPNPEITTTAMMVYFMPLSLFCLLLLLWPLTLNPASFLISVGLAILGLLLLYGWAIKAWQLPFFATSKAVARRRQEEYFHRIRRLDQIKSLDPIAFENFVGSLFEQMGYQVQTTSASGDEGIDLLLYQQGQLSIVQCKRYDGTVGQPVIRDLYGAMVHNQAREAYLVTTGTLSLPARQWAANKPIHLIDGNGLVEWLETLKRDSLLASPPGPPPWAEVFSELAGNTLALGLILTALAVLLLCWGSMFGFILFKQPLRQAGFLPLPILSSLAIPLSPPATDQEGGDLTSLPTVITGNQTVNLRSGPGTDYEVIGTFIPGERLEIIGRNFDTSWWQVATPVGIAWVSAGVVEAINADQSLIPVQDAPSLFDPLPAALPAPTRPFLLATATPGALPTPIRPEVSCICSFDVYNCLDSQALTCFDYCRSIGAGDVHRLDFDGNGLACDKQ